jgi:hypothetical protein
MFNTIDENRSLATVWLIRTSELILFSTYDLFSRLILVKYVLKEQINERKHYLKVNNHRKINKHYNQVEKWTFDKNRSYTHIDSFVYFQRFAMIIYCFRIYFYFWSIGLIGLQSTRSFVHSSCLRVFFMIQESFYSDLACRLFSCLFVCL